MKEPLDTPDNGHSLKEPDTFDNGHSMKEPLDTLDNGHSMKEPLDTLDNGHSMKQLKIHLIMVIQWNNLRYTW